MGKRDIKIDYGLIDDILRELKKYSEGLEEMQSAVEKINRTIHTSSDADSVRQLEKRYNKVKKRLDDSHGEVDALYNLLNSYRKDMTAIIKPKKGMTRVGRNDIYCNLKSVKMAIRDVMEVKKDVPLITDMGIDRTDAEKRAMTENYGKLEHQVWNSILSELNAEMEKSKKKLERYYKEKVVEYENMDDDYRLKAEKVRAKYASTWDHMKQAYANSTGEWKQIAKGALHAVTDFVKGLAFLNKIVYYANTGPAVAAIACLSPQPPEWTEKMLGESQEYFGPIAEALAHPVDAIKAMAQETSNVYETEGLVYTGAYVVADVMMGRVVTSGISKAAGTGAGAVDDIGDIAGKADDVTDVAETAGKMDDIAEMTGTAGKANDVAKIADDIGDIASDVSEGGRYSSFGEMSLEDGILYDDFWKQVKTGEARWGERPNADMLYSREYINNHIEKFREGGSYLISRDIYEAWVEDSIMNPKLGRPNELFITTASEIDKALILSDGDLAVLEKVLGFDNGTFSKHGGVVRIDINNPLDYEIRLPSGNEYGANRHFVSGGKTDGGTLEAVINNVPNADSVRTIIEDPFSILDGGK